MTNTGIFAKALLASVIIVFANIAFAQEPESYRIVGSGHVNDHANIINQSEEDQIRARLQDYQEKTSIEFAVVTVPSLGGMSVEEFTNRLANHWGVGDKQKDNGVVLLIAPVEGQLRLEVGDGLQGDLTDGASGALLDQHMMPVLAKLQLALPQEEKFIFTRAAVAGVNAVIAHLGDKPYAQRLEERQLAEQRAAEEARLRAEQTRTVLMFALPVVIVLVILIVIIARITAKQRREKNLQALYAKNNDDLRKAKELLAQAEGSLPEAIKHLSVLRSEHPEDAWKDVNHRVTQAPQEIKKQAGLVADVVRSHSGSGWQNAEKWKDSVSSLLSAAAALAGLASLAKGRIREIVDAKTKSPELTTQYIIKEKEVAEVLGHKDVKESTRNLLAQARAKYDEAVRVMKPESGVNWLGVYALLASAMALLDKARSSARADKDAAEEARRPKPVYRSTTSSRSTFSGTQSISRPSGGGMRIGGGGGFSGGGASRGFRR